MSRALRDIPAVRALAEREAREQYETEAALARAAELGDNPDLPGDWAWLVLYHRDMSDIRVAAHLALLTDLSRPASALALAGALAEHCSSDDVTPAGCVAFAHPAFWTAGPDDDATELWVAADGVSYRFDLDGFDGWDDASALLTVVLHVLGGAPAAVSPPAAACDRCHHPLTDANEGETGHSDTTCGQCMDLDAWVLP